MKLSEKVDGERLVDLYEYIVLYAWNEHFGAHTEDEVRKCELRYYKSDKSVHYIEDGNDKGTTASNIDLPNWMYAQNQYYATQNGVYKVTQQKVNFDPKAQIEEVRRYKDGSEELWEMKHKSWSNIIPT